MTSQRTCTLSLRQDRGYIVNNAIRSSLPKHSSNPTRKRLSIHHIAAGVAQHSRDWMYSIDTFRLFNPKFPIPALTARNTAVHGHLSDLTISHNTSEVITTWNLRMNRRYPILSSHPRNEKDDIKLSSRDLLAPQRDGFPARRTSDASNFPDSWRVHQTPP